MPFDIRQSVSFLLEVEKFVLMGWCGVRSGWWWPISVRPHVLHTST